MSYNSSSLLFYAVRGLRCVCSDAKNPDCVVFKRGTECGEGEQCAVVYDRYRNNPSDDPNPRQMCSGDLPPGACNGDLNNETLYIGCCNYSRCTESETFEPVYVARPTTVDLSITETTDAPTRPLAGGSNAGMCLCE